MFCPKLSSPIGLYRTNIYHKDTDILSSDVKSKMVTEASWKTNSCIKNEMRNKSALVIIVPRILKPPSLLASIHITKASPSNSTYFLITTVATIYNLSNNKNNTLQIIR